MSKPGEVHVRNWSATLDEDRSELFSFGESSRGRTKRAPWVRVDLQLLMSPLAYEEFSEMLRQRWNATNPNASKPLPPASPKLPAHDVIDAEFAEVGEDE